MSSHNYSRIAQKKCLLTLNFWHFLTNLHTHRRLMLLKHDCNTETTIKL